MQGDPISFLTFSKVLVIDLARVGKLVLRTHGIGMGDSPCGHGVSGRGSFQALTASESEGCRLQGFNWVNSTGRIV